MNKLADKNGVPLNVTEYVESALVGGFHILMMVLCGLVMIMDGFDLISMGMVVPTLSDDWGVQQAVFSRNIVSPVSAVLFGVILGSMGAGYLADKYGRRPIIIIMLVLAAIGMLLTTTITTLNELIIYRFFTGIGAGGSIPIAIAITSEFVPKKHRSLMVMTMYTGAPLGASLGGIIGPTLLEQYGWQGIFYFGGFTQLVIAVFILLLLPESAKFMARQSGKEEKLRQLLTRIRQDVNVGAITKFTFTEVSAVKSSIKALFTENRTKLTLALWLIFLGMQFVLFFVSLMMPAYLKSAGWSSTDALRPLGFYNFGALFGGIGIGILASRIGPANSLLFTLPASAILLTVLGIVVDQTPLFFAVAFFAGAITIGNGMALAPLAAAIYPTQARSTGIGSALGIGRGGSISAPYIGAIGLTAAWGAHGFFFIAAVAPVVCFIGLLLLMLFLKQNAISR